jgi:hypothetical protein
MSSTNDLFADQGPEFVPQPDRLEVVAGKIVATMNKPSAVQRRFNTLMERIAAEQQLSDVLRHALDTHGPAHRQALHAINRESQDLCKQMVLMLDQSLQATGKPKGLTPTQKQQAVRIVLGLCEQLAPLQDPAMEAVMARYRQVADEDDPESDDPASLDIQALLEAQLGGNFAQGRTFESPEAMLQAAMAYAQEKDRARAEKRDAKRAARKAQKGTSHKELAAGQKQLDAQNALRTVYRQLASALHPDREPDEQERARKTGLMSKVNAAYERKDLSTLLRMQLEAAQVDASKAGTLSEARLKAMCDLLAEQVKSLEMDTMRLRQAMAFEFGYPSYVGFKEADFLATLSEECENKQDDIAQMRADLARVQDDKALKAWLKEQARATKMRLRQHQAVDMEDILFSMMRRA